MGQKVSKTMDIDTNSSDKSEEQKMKSPHRMQYEAQTRVILKQLGNLEEIRQKLGLSQRKICQLLLVDPSAWTRWQKSGDAPPHIWRALQWYMALQEKLPGLTPNYFLGPFSGAAERENTRNQLKLELDLVSAKWKQLHETQEMRIHFLEKRLRFLRHLILGTGILAAVGIFSALSVQFLR